MYTPTIFSKNEAQKIKEDIFKVCCTKTEEGKKVMCISFPTEGLYLAQGLVRYVNSREGEFVDIKPHINEMKMRDFNSLKSALNVLSYVIENGGDMK